jgi:hypothetical protein
VFQKEEQQRNLQTRQVQSVERRELRFRKTSGFTQLTKFSSLDKAKD